MYFLGITKHLLVGQMLIDRESAFAGLRKPDSSPKSCRVSQTLQL